MKFKQIRIPSKDLKEVLNYIKREDADHQVIFTNILSDDHQGEFERVLSLREDCEKGLEHWVLAFPEEDVAQLTPELLTGIWKRFLTEMEVGPCHKFVVATHRKDKQHSHMLLSRVGTDSRLWHGKKSVERAMKITPMLEKEFGLTRTRTIDDHRDGLTGPRRVDFTKHEFEQKKRTGLPVRKELLAEAIEESLAASKGEFAAFASGCHKRGLEVHVLERHNGSKGISFTFEDVSYRGSKIGKQYSYNNIVKTLHELKTTGIDRSAPAITSEKEQLLELRDTAAAKNLLDAKAKPDERKKAEFEKKGLLDRLADLTKYCPKELEFEVTILYYLLSSKLYNMNFYWYLKKHVTRLEIHAHTILAIKELEGKEMKELMRNR